MIVLAKHGRRHLMVALVAGLGIGSGAAMADGLNIGLGVGSVSIGGESVASVNANVAGVGVKANVLGPSTNVANACVGSCGGTTTGGLLGTGILGGTGLLGGVGVNVGTTGVGVAVGPGTGPVIDPTTGLPIPLVPVSDTRSVRPLAPLAKMPCAADGNTAVYNGYTVVDRRGAFVGWVNDTKLDPSLKITQVRIQTSDKRCIGLTGGSYKVTGMQIMVNMN